ncbi:uncharacterized protein LOC134542974 [Bacillus rossius redtenbacheri]|uniref:uncharacterized protein LOC134542974 n=1 Tax=Bacillus rossius redtenbacheri TaxID=93214 RepID=UPI002FDE66B5
MKDGTCFADEINFSSTEFDDDLMECDVFCELVKGLDQDVVFDMAQRLTSILGQEPPPAASDDDDEDYEDYEDYEDEDGSRRSPLGGGSTEDEAALLRRDRSLVLAGYTECMDEAIRYLVEEERYSAEHPLVQGLRQHLVDGQERVLGAAQRLDNCNNNSSNSSNNNNNGGGEPDVSLVALLAGTILNVRQPSV